MLRRLLSSVPGALLKPWRAGQHALAQTAPDQEQQESEPSLRQVMGAVKGMEEKLGGMEKKLGGVQTGMEEKLEKGLGAVNSRLGVLIEDQVATRFASMQGTLYVEPVQLESLQDVAERMPRELRSPAYGFQPCAAKVVDKLLTDNVPQRLLPVLNAKHCPGQAWLHADGSVDKAALGSFIGECEDAALRNMLIALRRVLLSPSINSAKEQLLMPRGAGIPCLLAAACPEHYLRDQKQLPDSVLELDCGGRAELHEGCNGGQGCGATIDVAEIKSSLTYSKAVEHLGVRLKALSWLLCACSNVTAEKQLLVGRLLVPRREKDSQKNMHQMQNVAAKVWGFDLRVQRV